MSDSGGVVTRWTDEDGHTWPVTGQWCHECGLPLHALLVDAGEAGHLDCLDEPVGKPRAAATPATPLHAFTPPTGPGCGFHTETQGHRSGCEAPV